ncbi:group 1 truncated hemoglobin [Pseudoalteromonas sp. MMG013]|uniref:group I truncated hemoglobin n=1 Tax=Pseudoalteromonas sp. MMG013 TaxID=2822687 RepID=UPI001B398A14|nr:group 1 truncated hemoglobin [Pseudoalteromonas sp. MMG013]MBQ4862307.1 group 1 truncated hemoglobin [Pseudoalteromonas sp. MMG013]
MGRLFGRVTGLLCIVILLNACVTPKANVSLYHQLGGEPTIERIIDSFINEIGRHPTIIQYFKEANVMHFRTGFIQHMCALLDGPCKYTGDSMVQIHTGMDITTRDFNIVVELLITAMNEAGVSHVLQNQILARMAPLRSEIIKI